MEPNANLKPRVDDRMLAHLHVVAMLPWVANGSASAEQHRQVAEHLAHCEHCRGLDLAQHTQAAAVVPADAAVHAAPSTPVRRRRTVSRAVLAMLSVQALAIGAFSLHHDADGAGGGASYRTLSQGNARPGEATLRVLPAPQMTMARWTALLAALDLQVVEGPNASGAFALASMPAATASTEQQLQTLRQSDAIRLAEPITHPW